jgi:hypothetical protein
MVNPETIFNQIILCPLLAPPHPCLSLDFVVVEVVVVVGFADLEVSPYKLNVELLLALPAKASKVSKKALQDITWRIPR